MLPTAVVVLAALTGYPIYVSPTTDPLPTTQTPADVVLALGGSPDSGTYARSLVDEGLARHLVLSNPYGRDHNPVTQMCRAAPETVDPVVLCFAPAPSTTRGEAEELARLAASKGWRRVIIVAPTYHVTRARMIIRRCYRGQLVIVATPTQTPWWLWVYMYGYQTAGFVKAAVLRAC
jgi:uncharacterized SAM-binding protein YcdF (DUF218 family)